MEGVVKRQSNVLLLKCRHCDCEILHYLTIINYIFKQYKVPHGLRTVMLKSILQWCNVPSPECKNIHFLCPACQVSKMLRFYEEEDYFPRESTKELPTQLENSRIRKFYCNVCVGWICKSCGENTYTKGGYLCNTCLHGQCSDCIAWAWCQWTWCQCNRKSVCVHCAENTRWIMYCCDCNYKLKTVEELHTLSNDTIFVADGKYTCPKCNSDGICCDEMPLLLDE